MTATVRRDGAARDGADPPPPELAAAIRAAIGYLGDLVDPPSAVLDGRLDRMLRAAVTAHTHQARGRGDGDGRVAMDEAAAAVRTACAHLAARELEDAYLALRAAADRVPRPTG
ncbi:hypothetical protein [Actinomycetospora straminea]|uniref:Uncharacterized protein n=1 Tax=Actinomycetospora straminea TaxID=663607 RepID=A0ABP9EFJ2_9PSEU|nr:hypothetical protein [Actinomycetospora straminea]MDD7934440.1 hypothetical protein [Actinomycetospora straminea]